MEKVERGGGLFGEAGVEEAFGLDVIVVGVPVAVEAALTEVAKDEVGDAAFDLALGFFGGRF